MPQLTTSLMRHATQLTGAHLSWSQQLGHKCLLEQCHHQIVFQWLPMYYCLLSEVRRALACPQWQYTKLQPPFFSTGLLHFGQGLELALIQLCVSLSSTHFRRHFFHLPSHWPCHANIWQRLRNCLAKLRFVSEHGSSMRVQDAISAAFL